MRELVRQCCTQGFKLCLWLHCIYLYCKQLWKNAINTVVTTTVIRLWRPSKPQRCDIDCGCEPHLKP